MLPRMDDDREAFEFAHALYLARQVDRDFANLIAEAAEAGLIQLSHATELLTAMYVQAAGSHSTRYTHRRSLN